MQTGQEVASPLERYTSSLSKVKAASQTRSLHVGTITYDWYPADPRVRRLAEAAAAAGHDIDVICLRQPAEQRREVYHGIKIYRLPTDRGFGSSLPVTVLNWCWFLFISGLLITRLHFKQAYDVIHVHNMPDFLVFATLIPRLLGAKVILDVQDVSPELMAIKAKGRKRRVVTALARAQERLSTTFAHHVVTVGWPFEDLLLQRGVPREKLSVVINSVDPKLFPATKRDHFESRLTGRKTPFIIMYHGTVAERNGLDVAVRALALALREVPDLRLDIRGRGEDLPRIQQLAVELGVAKHVVITSVGPLEEVVDFVAHGDVGIIPYHCDGFMKLVLPTKAYELAWMRRPIIASDTPAIRSMFRPESVMLCDPNKPEEFAAAMLDLYYHPEKRAQLVDNAAADYDTFAWEPQATQYQCLLASLRGNTRDTDAEMPSVV